MLYPPRSAVLAETISYRHSLNYCSFRLIFGAFESDCMCLDAVNFKRGIWSLIYFFIGNWVKICTFCLHHEIGELRGYKGLVCPPDPLLHHSQSPDLSCFCTDHVASCCSRTIMPKFC